MTKHIIDKDMITIMCFHGGRFAFCIFKKIHERSETHICLDVIVGMLAMHNRKRKTVISQNKVCEVNGDQVNI